MPAYRLYKLRDANYIVGAPTVIQCDSDAEVVAKAKAMATRPRRRSLGRPSRRRAASGCTPQIGVLAGFDP